MQIKPIKRLNYDSNSVYLWSKISNKKRKANENADAKNFNMHLKDGFEDPAPLTLEMFRSTGEKDRIS